MECLTRSEPGIPIQPEQLDKATFLFNCQNGTIDLRTGKLRPHDQADLITKLSPTAYSPDATCPAFVKFLDSIFKGNVRIIQFVLRLLGYCLTGSVRERIFPIFHGDGSNGKSTLLTAFMATVGSDYAAPCVKKICCWQNRAANTQSYKPASLACGSFLALRPRTANGFPKGR